jgi:hypothetical protein
MPTFRVTYVIRKEEEIELEPEEMEGDVFDLAASMAGEIISQGYDYNSDDWKCESVEILE